MQVIFSHILITVCKYLPTEGLHASFPERGCIHRPWSSCERCHNTALQGLYMESVVCLPESMQNRFSKTYIHFSSLSHIYQEVTNIGPVVL